MTTGALLLVMALAFKAQSQDTEDAPEAFAVRAGWIYTLSYDEEGLPPLLQDGVLIIREGRIDAEGSALTYPPGCL